MRLLPQNRPLLALFTLLLSLLPFTAADDRIIESKSLSTCMPNSGLKAQLFNVALTPGNNSLYIGITGVSTVNGYVAADIDVTAYGYSFLKKTGVNPCDGGDINLQGLCPMAPGQIDISPTVQLPPGTISQIPG